MDPGSLLAWGLFLSGLGGLAGFLAGLLGVGGGVVLVPGLFFSLNAMGFPPDQIAHVAIGTSLAVIIPTSLSSMRAHWKRGAVRLDLARAIVPGILAGVLLGTIIADNMTGRMLTLSFAVMLSCLACLMLADPARWIGVRDLPPQPWPGLAGAVIGALSAMAGIGGATLSVPYMMFHRVPVREAIGTASLLGLAISAPATIGFALMGAGNDHLPPFSLGYVNLLAFALIVPGSVMAASWGADVAHAVPVHTLRRVFSAFIIIVAVRMAYGAFHE